RDVDGAGTRVACPLRRLHAAGGVRGRRARRRRTGANTLAPVARRGPPKGRCAAMRILFTTLNATSHLRLLAPIVLAARAAGHETLLAGPSGLAAEAAEYVLAFAPVGTDWTHDQALTSTVAQQLAFGAHEDYNRTLF